MLKFTDLFANIGGARLGKENMIKFIDLFAGIGGTRLGFEQACKDLRIESQCVFTSEVKDSAISVYQNNFPNSLINGDITKIAPKSIPDFDYLLAGFPCQPFSSAGSQKGFRDQNGIFFFTICKILKAKKPQGFILENVDGLATHDQGKTLETILKELKKAGFKTTWKILDSSEFQIPQKRRRIYIVGHRHFKPELDGFTKKTKTVKRCIDYTAPVEQTRFTKLLAKKFLPHELEGKSIKDSRGGSKNIHSWDLETKGKVTKRQRTLLILMQKQRRYKKWAEQKGIDWMDGMPLTLEDIKTFYDHKRLEDDLEYLTKKGYLRFEHPKKKIITDEGIAKRVPKTDSPKGYNIVTGKLSFPIVTILDSAGFCPTIVATESGKIGVSTDKGVRPITVKEGLLFSGFPETFDMSSCSYHKAFDLLGNTVISPVMKEVALRVLNSQKTYSA